MLRFATLTLACLVAALLIGCGSQTPPQNKPERDQNAGAQKPNLPKGDNEPAKKNKRVEAIAQDANVWEWRGRLTADAAQQSQGVDWKKDHMYRIDVVSKDFDPLLEVLTNAGLRYAVDDNDGDGHNARVHMKSGAGIPHRRATYQYTLVVRSKSGQGQGQFTTTVRSFKRANRNDRITKEGHIGNFTRGGQIRSSKTRFHVDLRAGYLYDIKVDSFFTRPEFAMQKNKRGISFSRNPRLVWQRKTYFLAEESGEYAFEARDRSGAQGSFNLSLQPYEPDTP